MSDPDPDKLRDLEERIARAQTEKARQPGAMKGIGQGEAAWRMVIELVTGMALGLAFGYGLDMLLGTKPVMMVIFVLLGFAAGIRTMLRTASELTKQAGEVPGKTDKAGQASQEKGK
jgi:ATP synthase protein I